MATYRAVESATAKVKDGPAVAQAKVLGIHPEVSTELMALTTLFPGAVGSPFRQHQPDALHVVPKIFQVVLKLVDHVAGGHAGPGRLYRYTPTSKPLPGAQGPEPQLWR